MGPTSVKPLSQPLLNAIELGNRFVLWLTPYGALDPEKCVYRTPGKFAAYHLHFLGPVSRALYRLYGETKVEEYRASANRCATFLMNTLHDPVTPHASRAEINGQLRGMLSSAWQYGKALSPCYEWFCRNNPNEDAYELKALAIYRWLQRHRREDSYFGVGYPTGNYPDAQFSADLGEVGTGLVGFYNISGHEPALADAFGLAQYFLTDYQDGSGRGIWSPAIGAWLVGPWPGSGAEHFTNQVYNRVAWGSSQLMAAEFLLSLRKHSQDAGLQARIADKCVKAFQWCIDVCQFEDGAHGMFGRDDKWVGQGAAAILLYAGLKEQDLVPSDLDRIYRPKIEKSWQWMLEHTHGDTFPTDGYIEVSGTTKKKPLENLVWRMAWTTEALIVGEKVFTS